MTETKIGYLAVLESQQILYPQIINNRIATESFLGLFTKINCRIATEVVPNNLPLTVLTSQFEE
jgi:hypothetical protein